MTAFDKINAAYSLTPPLGLAYIAGYLRNKSSEHDIKIIDCLISESYIHKSQDKTQYGLSDDEILRQVQEYDPHIVGITSMYTAFCYDIFRISKLVKTINRNIEVVIGGSYATEYYSDVIKNSNIDFIVLGEGEETFTELIDVFNSDRNYYKVKSLVFKDKGKIVVNPIRQRITNLDSIPFPARDLLNMKAYINYTNINGKAKAMEFPVTTMITSRGCPMSCVYCSVKQVWGRKWTYHSSKYVVDEMESLIKYYGIKEFQILDDSMSANPNRLNDICDEIINRKLNISWTMPNGIAHWTLNRELLLKMRISGCYRITFGIESANYEIRKYIGKTFKLDNAGELIKYANKIGMWTVCTFIMGFPNESFDQMKETLNFAINSGTDIAFFYALIPHPGTSVYSDYVKITKNNYLMDILNELSVEPFNNFELLLELQRNLSVGGQVNIKYTDKEIEEFVSNAQKTFFRKRIISFLHQPFHYLQKIHSYKDIIYFYEIIKLVIKVIINILISKSKNVTISRMLYKKQTLEK